MLKSPCLLAGQGQEVAQELSWRTPGFTFSQLQNLWERRQVVRMPERLRYAKWSGPDVPTQSPAPPISEVRKPESGCSDE